MSHNVHNTLVYCFHCDPSNEKMGENVNVDKIFNSPRSNSLEMVTPLPGYYPKLLLNLLNNLFNSYTRETLCHFRLKLRKFLLNFNFWLSQRAAKIPPLLMYYYELKMKNLKGTIFFKVLQSKLLCEHEKKTPRRSGTSQRILTYQSVSH